jgi:uncharacterized phage protein (TIGR01671 family)
MNRYTYKAKRKDNGELIKGSLIIERSSSMCLQEYGIPFIENYYIYTIEDNHYVKVEIKKETLCQCTGLKDRDCNYIFENDILEIEYDNQKHYKSKAIIEYELGMFYFNPLDDNWIEDWSFQDDVERFKIIGNRFDEVKYE